MKIKHTSELQRFKNTTHWKSQISHFFFLRCINGEKETRRRNTERVRSKNNRRELKWRGWEGWGQCLRETTEDAERARCGGVWRVFIYTVGFMASRVCCTAWEQHHFRLEWPRAPSNVLPKSARQQNTNKNPLTFSPPTAVFIWVTAQEDLSLSLHWSHCFPADSKRSQPTRLSDQIEARNRQREGSPWYANDLWGRN